MDELNKLKEKVFSYNPNFDFALIEKAYLFAKDAHEGQLRESGEPYIKHPIYVANILADFELDAPTIAAGLLHDIIEDTDISYTQVKELFGEAVAQLVDGVTKLGKIPYTTKEEQQAENLRKMLLAMAKDIRVILIKLADRLHNMRTLKYVEREKQIEKARETLEIYAPLAHRLGIYSIKWELEDLCLRYLDPEAYYDLVDKISTKRKERESFINNIIVTIKQKLVDLDIEGEIEGRPKHFYSIYRKMMGHDKSIEDIYDLFALRVIVNSVKDCYSVLGLVHEMYKPMPGRFKDYIAMPKPNMYQSLHTTLMSNEGIPFEIQIRTWDMHRTAEYGIAAHWKYKEGRNTPQGDDMDSKLSWLRQILEWQGENRDDKQFMETLKFDLFSDEVFVFTPRGDVKNLPVDSTPIDFAYSIHSQIGNKMTGAKVNGKIVPINYTLKNGDIVEVITSATTHGPSRDWLKVVKSTEAKSKIQQWFKKERREENVQRGKEIVERELKRQGLTFAELFKPEWVDIILQKYTFNTLDDCFAAIGFGGITAVRVITRLKEEYRKVVKVEETAEELKRKMEKQNANKVSKRPTSGVIVKGIENCLIRLSKCCNPVPGDEIIGYVTRGRGVSIHRKDCTNANEIINATDRLIEVKWYEEAKNVAYVTHIQVLANDRVGLLSDVTNAVSEAKSKLIGVNGRTSKDKVASFNFELEVEDTEQLNKTIKNIKKVDSVFEVVRNKS